MDTLAKPGGEVSGGDVQGVALLPSAHRLWQVHRPQPVAKGHPFLKGIEEVSHSK